MSTIIQHTLLVLLLSVGSVINISAQGIDFFEGTWAEALEEAKKADKIIFVDAYTTWCGPCKMMSKKVFPEASVGELFNQQFINLKLDMESSESKVFKKSFTISAYPTLLFINSEGKLVHKSVGAKQPKALIAEANLAIRKNDKSGRYEEDYLNGNRDYDLVFNYVKALNAVDKPSLKISNDYINSKPDISQNQLAEFLHIALVDSDSKLYTSYLKYEPYISKKYGREAFISKALEASWKTVDKAIEFEYEDLIKDAAKSLKKIDKKSAEEFELAATLKYASAYADAVAYNKSLGKYYKKYAKKDANKLTGLIKEIENNFSKNKALQVKSLDYTKQWVSLAPSEQSYLSYLTKLKNQEKYKEAVKVGNDAIDWLKQNNKNTSRVEKYVKHIETLI